MDPVALYHSKVERASASQRSDDRATELRGVSSGPASGMSFNKVPHQD